MERHVIAVVLLIGALGICDAALTNRGYPWKRSIRETARDSPWDRLTSEVGTWQKLTAKLSRSKRETYIPGLPDNRVDIQTQQNILNRHNTQRRSVGAADLQWNGHLGELATYWSSTCPSGPPEAALWATIPELARWATTGIGANIRTSNTQADFTGALDTWINSRSTEYNQIINSATTHIGCDSGICGSNFVVVCLYAPSSSIGPSNCAGCLWSNWGSYACHVTGTPGLPAPCSTQGSWTRTRNCTINNIPQQQCAEYETFSGQQQCTGPCVTTNAWNQWSQWSSCACLGGSTSGSQSRSRSCLTGNCNSLPGEGFDTRNCFCQGVPAWNPWQEWSACNSLCQRVRYRTCSSGVLQCGNENSQTTACTGGSCQQIGQWGQWLQWTLCTATVCNQQGIRTRSRSCVPSTSQCTGGQPSEQEACVGICLGPQWGQWSQWSQCSVTCGFGTQTRQRQCFSTGGQNQCTQAFESQTNNCQAPVISCPTPSFWGQWGPWSICPLTCTPIGGGSPSRTRTRVCTGVSCPGESVSQELCATQTCPQVGFWTQWGQWSICPATCTPIGGVSPSRSRARTCSGINCPGNSFEVQQCGTQSCPQVSFWNPWGQWSACPATCTPVGGVPSSRTRTRTCSGVNCGVDSIQVQQCGIQSCPQVSFWNQWGQWSVCPATCTPIGGVSPSRSRSRICNGFNCPGDSVGVQQCGTQSCPQVSLWNQWGPWSACPATCTPVGGVSSSRSRTRFCSGVNCPGASVDVQPCGVASCPQVYVWNVWGQWSACSATCTQIGGIAPTRTRSRSCPVQNTCQGGQAVGVETCSVQTCQTTSCCQPWGPATCTVACGQGILSRTRTCFGCTTVQQTTQTGTCFFPPAECETTTGNTWTQWSSWSTCSATCVGGAVTPVRSRTRVCQAPGGVCTTGVPSEVQQCTTNILPTCTTVDQCLQASCFPTWGNWEAWRCYQTATSVLTLCNQAGQYARRRVCPQNQQVCFQRDGTCDGSTNCNTGGNWGQWGPWSICSATCITTGGTTPTRTRTRACLQGTTCTTGPNTDTQECTNLSTCTGTGICSGTDAVFNNCFQTGIPRYYYNTATASCAAFTWRGCAGSNNFLNLADCQSTCQGGTQVAFWSEWTDISTCSVACGSGFITRQRICEGTGCTQATQSQSFVCVGTFCTSTTCEQCIGTAWNQWQPWICAQPNTNTPMVGCTQGNYVRTRQCGSPQSCTGREEDGPCFNTGCPGFRRAGAPVPDDPPAGGADNKGTDDDGNGSDEGNGNNGNENTNNGDGDNGNNANNNNDDTGPDDDKK